MQVLYSLLYSHSLFITLALLDVKCNVNRENVPAHNLHKHAHTKIILDVEEQYNSCLYLFLKTH